MTEDDKRELHPASLDEVKETLCFALRFDGRKRIHQGDILMAQITAERLIRQLERSGFVLMKKPSLAAPSTSGHRHPNTD